MHCQIASSRGLAIEISNWFWEGVMMKGGVLSIDRAYFNITGGRERWLHEVARKHAGGAGEEGFAISVPVLFEKSGATGEYRRFKSEILKLAEKNALPGYGLSVEAGKGAEPLWPMRHVNGKDGVQTIPRQGPDEQREKSKHQPLTRHGLLQSEPQTQITSAMLFPRGKTTGQQPTP